MLVGAIMAGAILSSGCVTMAAMVGCGIGSGSDCSDETLEVTGHLDGVIFDAILGSDDGPRDILKRVSVEGVVTSSGTPLHQAKVDLSWGSELWTVRTDRSGRYQIQGVVEPGHCSDLRFTIRHPDQRTTYPFPVKCGEQQLDYDFPPVPPAGTSARAPPRVARFRLRESWPI